jgi:hypothetical protein
MDQTVGEAETSYEYTVPGDRRGQAICLGAPIGTGIMVPFTACSQAGSVTEDLCVASSSRLDDTGESERGAVAVETWTVKWVADRFQPPP